MTAPFANSGRYACFALALLIALGAAPEEAAATGAKTAPLPPARPVLAHEVVPLPPFRPAAKGQAVPLPPAPQPQPGAPALTRKSEAAPVFKLASLPRHARAKPRMFRADDDLLAVSSQFTTVQTDPLAGVPLAAPPVQTASADPSRLAAMEERTAAAEKTAENKSGIPLPPDNPKFASLKAGESITDGTPLPPKRPRLKSDTVPLPPVAPSPSKLLTKQDYDNLKRAFEAIERDDFDSARTFARRAGSDTARDLVEWRIVHSAPITIGYDRIAAFLDKDHNWPGHDKLVRRAEEALFEHRRNVDKVLNVFQDIEPVSGPGMASYAYALSRSGNKKAAKEWLSRAWRTHWLTDPQEAQILRRFGKLLSKKDHKARFDSLLYRGSYSSASRLLRYVGSEYKNVIAAHSAVKRKHGSAARLLSRLPKSVRDDPVVLYSRIQWLRRKGRVSDATDLMLKAPRKRALVVNPRVWWDERHILAREMIDLKKYDKAYRLASEHALFGGADYAQAEFLAGWLALRHLDKPKQAEKHFRALRARVRRPISISRAEYWIGRAKEAQGEEEKARAHYAKAASHSTYFYGQLARLKLGGEVLYYPDVPRPDDRLHTRFRSNELVRAATMLNEIGQIGLARRFIMEIAEQQHDPQGLYLTATMASQFGMRGLGHRVGKIANIKGFPMVDFAFMTDALPSFKRRGHQVEDALIHALVRQESAFNSGAVSHAGAQGLMQLMPPTARAVAKQHGAPYSKSRLLSDPAYNAMLGTAHLGDLIDNWNGSYIMAVAAYNAGEYRLKQWIGRYGDPRDPKVDPIDWIESIPFSETRNYVHRVLENLQVYRARLNDNLGNLKIASDLARGRSSR